MKAIKNILLHFVIIIIIIFILNLQMASKTLAKPQMRGLLQSQIKKNLIVAGVLAICGGAIYKFTVAEPRKAKYAEFYK